jgi:hypothetical protein
VIRDFETAVVIPAHNGMPDVLDAVGSAIEQTLPPAEVVLVDDASTDGTAGAVRSRFGGLVRIVSGRFGSAAAARNAGWREARAPWVALLDADDLWFRDKLATAAALLADRPDAAWFFSDGEFRSLDGAIRASWVSEYADLPDPYFGQPVGELFEVNFILTSSVVVRRSVLESVGGFDDSLTHAEDLDLWIRLARAWPCVGSGRALVRYQHRPGGLTRQVESRLKGDITLFGGLGTDNELAPSLRARARRREGMARYKLSVAALREGRGAEARSHLGAVWRLPGRVLPAAGVWLASLLPAPIMAWLRRNAWIKHNLAAPTLRLRRVTLKSEATPSASGTTRGAA